MADHDLHGADDLFRPTVGDTAHPADRAPPFDLVNQLWVAFFGGFWACCSSGSSMPVAWACAAHRAGSSPPPCSAGGW